MEFQRWFLWDKNISQKLWPKWILKWPLSIVTNLDRPQSQDRHYMWLQVDYFFLQNMWDHYGPTLYMYSCVCHNCSDNLNQCGMWKLMWAKFSIIDVKGLWSQLNVSDWDQGTVSTPCDLRPLHLTIPSILRPLSVTPFFYFQHKYPSLHFRSTSNLWPKFYGWKGQS